MPRKSQRITGAAAKRAALVRTLQEQGAPAKEFRKVADVWLNRGRRSIKGVWDSNAKHGNVLITKGV